MEIAMTKETMTITAAQFTKLRATSKSGNWKQDIVQYLKTNQGCDELAMYNATRPDRLEISEAKKRHNLASQFSYLRDEGYLVQKQDSKCYLLTEPSDKPGEFKAVEGQEARLKALL